MSEAIKKDPDNFFEKQGNLLAQKLKKGEIDKNALEDVSRLDLMKEVLNLRLKIFLIILIKQLLRKKKHLKTW